MITDSDSVGAPSRGPGAGAAEYPTAKIPQTLAYLDKPIRHSRGIQIPSSSRVVACARAICERVNRTSCLINTCLL